LHLSDWLDIKDEKYFTASHLHVSRTIREMVIQGRQKPCRFSSKPAVDFKVKKLSLLFILFLGNISVARFRDDKI